MNNENNKNILNRNKLFIRLLETVYIEAEIGRIKMRNKRRKELERYYLIEKAIVGKCLEYFKKIELGII